MAMSDGDKMAAGPSKESKVPACTAKYYPAQGGYEAEPVEADGSAGEKAIPGGAPGSEPTGNTTEGEYTNATGSFGSYPHGAEDASLLGPALGTTVGPNGDVDMGDRSPGGNEPNQPRYPGPFNRPVS